MSSCAMLICKSVIKDIVWLVGDMGVILFPFCGAGEDSSRMGELLKFGKVFVFFNGNPVVIIEPSTAQVFLFYKTSFHKLKQKQKYRVKIFTAGFKSVESIGMLSIKLGMLSINKGNLK